MMETRHGNNINTLLHGVTTQQKATQEYHALHNTRI